MPGAASLSRPACPLPRPTDYHGRAQTTAPRTASSAALPSASTTRREAYPAATRSLPSTAAARMTHELKVTSTARLVRRSKLHGTAEGAKPFGVPGTESTSSLHRP
jgi:hypothetical protein